MKVRRPLLQGRQQQKGSQQRPKQLSDYKKIVNEKIQAKKSKNPLQQRYGLRSHKTQGVQQAGIQPLSAKNEGEVRPTNKKYFKKESNEMKTRVSLSQDTKVPSQKASNNNQNQKTPQGFQRANSQYLLLHDKLNFLESKIADMKKNLQKKKQQKIRKHKQKQIKQKKKSQQAKSKKKPSKLDAIVTSVPEPKEMHAFERDPYSPKHNIYYVSQIVRAYKDARSLAREHLQTTLQIMAYFERIQKPSQDKLAQKKVNLVRRKGYQDKKTVVFDLDETLIHCNQNLDVPYDIKLPIVFPTGQIIEAGVNIRPHAIQILENLSKNFEIIVFTASHSCYANVVLDHLDPENKYIHHRLFRQHCYATQEGMHVKDLRVINRDLSQMVLVDNAAYSYAFQYQNGIPIIPYYHGSTDFQLKALQSYIESMLLVKDMRSVNRRTFKLHEYHNYYYGLEKLVEQLYLVEHDC